jgi:hypothetical protein
MFVQLFCGTYFAPNCLSLHIVGEVNSTPRQEDTSTSQTGSVLFREIHKNAWLKRLPSVDKKTTGAFPKV